MTKKSKREYNATRKTNATQSFVLKFRSGRNGRVFNIQYRKNGMRISFKQKGTLFKRNTVLFPVSPTRLEQRTEMQAFHSCKSLKMRFVKRFAYLFDYMCFSLKLSVVISQSVRAKLEVCKDCGRKKRNMAEALRPKACHR